MDVYIGMEGFTLPRGFIVKELCMMYQNEEFSHFLFKAPLNTTLSDVDQRTVRYTTDKLNRLSWHDGNVPFECLSNILKEV